MDLHILPFYYILIAPFLFLEVNQLNWLKRSGNETWIMGHSFSH